MVGMSSVAGYWTPSHWEYLAWMSMSAGYGDYVGVSRVTKTALRCTAEGPWEAIV